MGQDIMGKLDGKGKGPWVIGHRGASGYAPENTMASFERALALGADAIELDIHPTRDGELVVIHDLELARTTSGRGRVSDHPLAEIRALDAGSWFGPSFAGERVPTLRQVLEWARGRVKVVIEIKQGPVFHPQIPALLLEVLDRAAMRADVLVISFDHFSVKEMGALAPDVTTGVLYAARPVDAPAMARAAGALVLMPHWAMVERDDVLRAHAASLLIAPWGGPEQDYARLLSLGVDAVGADFPDRPRALLDRAGS